MTNVANWLEISSNRYQDKTALITNKGLYSYNHLEMMSSSIAHHLQDRGITKGERFLICTNEPQLVISAIFASLKIGVIFVVIHPETPEDMIQYYAAHSGASVILIDKVINLEKRVSDQLKLKIHSAPKGNTKNWESIDNLLNYGRNQFISLELLSTDTAALIYTSGSSGKPKGVISTHGNIIFSTETINNYLMHTSSDTILCFLPLSFDYGLYQIFLCFSKGATLIIKNSKYFAFEAPRIIKAHNVTGIAGVRNLLTTFCKIRNFHTQNNIRYITNTGEYLDLFTIKELKKLVPKADIFLMYGLTECKRVSYLPPKLLETHYKSVGYPLPGTQVKIVDEKGNECKPYINGELLVKGPHVTKGYWKDIPETEKRYAVENGETYLKTGDIFYKDSEGLLYFVGRKDLMFKSKGFRIEPEEIESQLKRNIEAIHDMVAVDYHDKKDNSVKIGYCIRTSHTDIKELKRQVESVIKNKMEPWKRPSKLIITSELPLTNSGKINREKIRTLFENKKEEEKGYG